MRALREEHRVGLDSLTTVTTLLQRVRRAHPTAGLSEAADHQWWWRAPRPTDTVPQLFWLDDLDRPAAAAILVDWGDRVALDPVVLPDATPDHVAHVLERGLAHAAGAGFDALGLEVDATDAVRRAVLLDHGFTGGADAIVETWMDSDARPPTSPLADGYRLSTRRDTAGRPHHMVGRSGPDVEARLRQTSLYRDDLDLVVLDEHDAVAAYGLFWYDPVTATGLVEPMRTEDAHQRRGLARHVLTAGIDRLAAAGAERVKICYEPDNPASSRLYLDVGFRPTCRTVAFTRRAGVTPT